MSTIGLYVELWVGFRSTYAGSDDESCISGCTWSASRRGGSIAGRVRANGRPAGRQPRRKAGWLVASGGAAIRIVVAGLIAAIAVKGAVSVSSFTNLDPLIGPSSLPASQLESTYDFSGLEPTKIECADFGAGRVGCKGSLWAGSQHAGSFSIFRILRFFKKEPSATYNDPETVSSRNL